jgi:hypothetical protein
MASFDNYAIGDVTEKYTQYPTPGSGDVSTITTVGRNSTNGFKMAANGGTTGSSRPLCKVLAPSNNTIIVGVGFRNVTPFSELHSSTSTSSSGAGQSAVLLSVRDLSTEQCWVRVDTAGTITVFRGTTSLGTTSIALSQNVYAYIETLLTIHNTAGAVTIRINGTTVLGPLTSQNTRNGSTNTWNEFRLGYFGAGAGRATEWNIDDLYVCDGSGSAPHNTFLGDCRVDPRRGTAPGATTGWTPSTGANWQNVDDTAPDDDTTYNSAASTGLTDTFVTEDAPVVGATIYGIQHNISMKKSDAGICTVAPVIRHSGVDNAGAALSPGTSYAYGLQIATEIAPGVAITESNFNAAEFGYTRLA